MSGTVDEADWALLHAEIIAGTNNLQFDVNLDGFVDASDAQVWAGICTADATCPNPGDFNFDGALNCADVLLFTASAFVTSPPGDRWMDLNVDGVLDGQDYLSWSSLCTADPECLILETGVWPFNAYGCTTLPVELVSFEALARGEDVVLSWTTASETNNAGFSIEQEIDAGAFTEIGYVEGYGTTQQEREYNFVVNDLDPGLHRFRLKQIDFDGAFEYSPVVEGAVTVPEQFLIEPAYPNPFNPSTTLRFAVDVEQQVDVQMLNVAGQAVRTLFNGTVAANEMQTLQINADGLPSGTYLVHFSGGMGLEATERIVLAK